MLRPIVMLGVAGILVASALGLSVPSKLGGGSLSLLKHLPEIDAQFNRVFSDEFLSRSNTMRNRFAVSSLKADPEIEAFVTAYVEADHAPESIRLNSVFDALQKKFPGAQYLAANLVSASNRDDLLSQLSAWDELAHPEFHDVSTAVVPSGRRLVALSVLSRRIPKFTVDGANNGGGRFFNVCPHEGSIHALDLDRKNKTLILSCPDCDRPYDVLAADSKRQMRRAIDFFTGFQLPTTPVMGTTEQKKQSVMEIWNIIADRCSYEHDHSEYAESEVWKTSDETWMQKQGDCEDTSILMVDSLISAGFEARVAIGWNGNIGQHAWVVVKIDDEQYVIESTIQENPTLADLVPVKDASPFYRPEQQFDRKYLYFPNKKPTISSADYYGEETWKAVSWN